MLSDEQAEPEWTATPARSSPMSTGSASTPCTPRQTRWGSRSSGAAGPTTSTPSTAERGVDDGARSWRRAAPASSSMQRRRSSAASAAAAAPKARRAGSASSPARRPRSCSPPTRRGSNRLPRRTTSAPAPGTPPSLCALTLTRSAPSAPGRWRRARTAAAASTCTVTPASRHSSTTSCTGWSVPTSWLAHWQCTSAGRGADARLQALAAARRRRAGRCRPPRAPRSAPTRAEASRDRGVLDGGAEHGRARMGAGRTPDGGVDGLGGARGEDHLARPRRRRGRPPARGPSSSASRTVRPSSCSRPGSAGGRPAQLRERGRAPRAAAVWCWRGRGRREPRGAQAEAVQASSPRAREDRITGSACCDAVPHSPASSPLTMPRSTAHSTGLVLLASPKGHCSAIDGGGLAAVLGVGGEAVGGQGLGHHVHGGPHRALPLARGHARRERTPVLLADVRRHLLGLFGPEPLHGLAEQAHQEVVAPLHEAERELLLHAEVPLGGPAGAGGVAPGLDPEVAAVDQALEVVAGHVGVQREGGGDLGGGHAGQRRGRGGRCRAGSDRRRRPTTAATAALNRPSSAPAAARRSAAARRRSSRDRSGAHGG